MYEVGLLMFVKQGKCFTSFDKNSAFDSFVANTFFSKVWITYMSESLQKTNFHSKESFSNNG